MATKIALVSYPCPVHRFVKCMRALQLNRSLNEQCGIKLTFCWCISIGYDGFNTKLTWNLVDSSIGPSFTVSVSVCVCVCVSQIISFVSGRMCAIYSTTSQRRDNLFISFSIFRLISLLAVLTWFCWLCAFVWKRINHPNEHADLQFSCLLFYFSFFLFQFLVFWCRFICVSLASHICYSYSKTKIYSLLCRKHIIFLQSQFNLININWMITGNIQCVSLCRSHFSIFRFKLKFMFISNMFHMTYSNLWCTWRRSTAKKNRSHFSIRLNTLSKRSPRTHLPLLS